MAIERPTVITGPIHTSHSSQPMAGPPADSTMPVMMMLLSVPVSTPAAP
mgnify:CR=1 FL=1